MEITGKLIQKLPVQSGVTKQGNNWQSQDLIIETIETYPKKICVNFYGDKIQEADKINIGDKVTVSVNIESREFNGKWFTSVKMWKVTIDQAAPVQSKEDYFEQLGSAFNPEQTDDLPF